jgi:hypothetical protein
MLLILSVDGLDYDRIMDMSISKFEYNKRLSIPKECFVMSAEGLTPHTTRVWASMFSGLKIDYGSIRRKGLRAKGHDILVKAGITWKRGKPKYTVNPYNKNLDLIFDYYHSFNWNCPTINPEWIATFPNYQGFERYCERELLMWLMITEGAANQWFDLCSFYTRFIDYIGHNKPDELDKHYHTIFNQVNLINAEHELDVDVILVSDHGTKDGIHTDNAYIGSDTKISANSIHELRIDFERILLMKGVDRIKQKKDDAPSYTEEEEKAIMKRLKGLGYVE